MKNRTALAWCAVLLTLPAAQALAAECSATEAFGVRFDAPIEASAPPQEIYKLYWQSQAPIQAGSAPRRLTVRASYSSRTPFAVEQVSWFEKKGLFGVRPDGSALNAALKKILDGFADAGHPLEADSVNAAVERGGSGWVRYHGTDASLRIEIAAQVVGRDGRESVLQVQCASNSAIDRAWAERGIVYPNPNLPGANRNLRFEMRRFEPPSPVAASDPQVDQAELDSRNEQLRKAESASQILEQKRADLPAAESLPAYFAEVRRWIQKFVIYPNASVRADEQGKVSVLVEMKTSGEVVNARIARSSGFQRLDDAALGAVWSADLLPAVPEFLRQPDKERYEVLCPIAYVIED